MTAAYEVVPVRAVVPIIAGSVVADTAGLVCIAPSRIVAERIAQLLDRHGLIDIPDTLAGEAHT